MNKIHVSNEYPYMLCNEKNIDRNNIMSPSRFLSTYRQDMDDRLKLYDEKKQIHCEFCYNIIGTSDQISIFNAIDNLNRSLIDTYKQLKEKYNDSILPYRAIAFKLSLSDFIADLDLVFHKKMNSHQELLKPDNYYSYANFLSGFLKLEL